RVLDFGAGNGRLAIPLARQGFDVVAVDASTSMLAHLKRRAKDAGVTLTVVKSDGANLLKSLNRKKVDAAIARAVLIHHDHEGVERIARALASVTKVGGRLVADWPTGAPQVRQTWTQVTIWESAHRKKIAEAAGWRIVAELGDATGPTLFERV
ncbi:class I SAM-dependent methyltransferase, partial [Streptomyces noursei]|uniref:class I SAM-dependent methyltransferase n=1 Tax=Streptomyces noursei TaxID=1971 RepID=UPI00344CB813